MGLILDMEHVSIRIQFPFIIEIQYLKATRCFLINFWWESFSWISHLRIQFDEKMIKLALRIEIDKKSSKIWWWEKKFWKSDLFNSKIISGKPSFHFNFHLKNQVTSKMLIVSCVTWHCQFHWSKFLCATWEIIKSWPLIVWFFFFLDIQNQWGKAELWHYFA